MKNELVILEPGECLNLKMEVVISVSSHREIDEDELREVVGLFIRKWIEDHC